MAKQRGWRTAPQIIEQWNTEHGTAEHATLVGQMLARLGLQHDRKYRTPKKAGWHSLYSAEAQVVIWQALERRHRRNAYYARAYSRNETPMQQMV
jgi:hypothetical protein